MYRPLPPGRHLDLANPVSDDPLNDGLVERWQALPEMATWGSCTWEGLGRKYPGTLTNGPAWVGPQGRPGGGGALSLASGSSQSVQIPGACNFTGDLTLAWWMYDAGSADGAVWLYKGQFLAGGYYGQVNNSQGALNFDTNQPGAHQGSTTSAFAHSTGVWEHWAVVLSGSAVNFYKNGQAVGKSSSGTHAAPGASADAFGIGAYASGSSNFFLGRFDDVRGFDRALSAAQVYALYEDSLAGSPRTLRRLSTRAWFIPDAADSPLKVAGCALWAAARLENAYSNGNSVGAARDNSGRGSTLRASGSARPTYTTGVINSLPVYRFDGSANVMTAPVPAGAAKTIFVVVKTQGGSGDRTVHSLDTACQTLTNGGGAWGYYSATPTSSYGGGAATSWRVLATRLNSASDVDLYADGAAGDSGDPDNAYAGSTTLALGSYTGLNLNFLDGDVAELIVYDNALSDADLAYVTGYLQDVYALGGGGGGGASGDLSVTLGALTASASGQAAVAGSASATLEALSLSGAGAAAVTAAASPALDALTLSGAGAAAVTAAAAFTLDALALAGAGAVSAAAEADLTLADVTLAAAGGGPGVSGGLSVTLGALGVSASGAAAVSGSLASVLGAASLSAAGAAAAAGTLGLALGAASLSGSGAVTASGSSSVTLGALALSGSGAAAVTGTLGAALATLSLSASGTGATGATGSLSATLGALALSAVGYVTTSPASSGLADMLAEDFWVFDTSDFSIFD